MALKVLLLRNKLDSRKKKLDELREKEQEFEKREAELEAAIEEMTEETPEEERDVVEQQAEQFQTEKDTYEKEKKDLETEIAGIEEEIRTEEEKQPKPEKKEKREKGEGKMETRRTEHGVFFGIRYLSELALLTALVLIMAYTPLGYLKTPWGVEITFIVIPVAVGSIILGPMAGGFLGLVFGLTSFFQCFGASP